MALVLGLSAVAGAGSLGPRLRDGGVRDYRSLRYEGVIAQTGWHTCGPAAAATLLQHFFGVPATEADLLELAVEEMAALGQDPHEGISALALVRALARYGLPVRGFRVEVSDLVAYFHQGGLPAILHVTVPESHFLVAVGAVGQQVLLADPSFGRYLLPWPELETGKGFSGI